MTVFLDTNIYVYALGAASDPRHAMALRIADWQFAAHAVVTRQVLGELLNVTHRKRSLRIEQIRSWVGDIENHATVLATDGQSLTDASLLADRYQLQFWDAVICTIARRHGASVLLSEDMQDGLRLGTMTIVNPFADSNRSLIEDIISS